MIEQAPQTTLGALARQPIGVIDPETPQGQETSLRDFLGILRRRKAIAIQTFVVVLAMGVVVTFMTRPAYRSSARILVEGKNQQLSIGTLSDDPLQRELMPQAGHDVSTQVEVLRSPNLLNKVCEAVGTTPRAVALEVREVGATDVIEIAATSASRDLAERFAATLPTVYLGDIRQNRLHEVSSALDFAQRRLKERNTALDKAELAMERFKTQRGFVSSEQQRKEDITSLNEARAAVSQAEAETASARARYEALASTRTSLPRLTQTPTTRTNPQISALRDNIASLESERARLLYLFKPDQDEVKRVDVQIADLQRRLRSTPATITTVESTTNPARADFDAKVSEARAAVQSASASLSEARARVTSLSAGLPGYNSIELVEAQLQRAIDTGRTDVAKLTASVMDLSLRKEATEAKDDPIKVIAAADRATQVSPRVMRNIVFATLLGLLLACGAALLQDSLDDHINDEEETRWLLDTPILGHLPLMPEGQSHLISLQNTDSHLLERFRVLRSNVQFTLVNRPNRSLMLTSTIPEEGKSSTASNLAIAMALDGRRMILVDADLHRPKLDSRFNLARQPGLTNVLAGQTSLEDALQDTEIPGLRVLTSGVLPPNPAELLNSSAMDELLEAMKEISDTVIFDSPPCLATADAQVLSAKVDGVIYVMELGKVRKSAVQRSFELLHQAHAHVLGVVFNKIDQTAHGNHYYSYYYGYYGEDKSEEGKKSAAKAQALDGATSKAIRTRRSGSAGSNGVNGNTNGASNGASHDGADSDSASSAVGKLTKNNDE